MLSDKQKRFAQFTIILICVILASIFLLPLLNKSTEASGLVGGIIGILIIIAVFPETRKAMIEQPSEDRMKRLMGESQLGFYRFLTHPTQMPLTFAMFLFIAMILVIVLLNFLKTKIDPIFFQIILLIIAFLWGLSGFLMLARKEYIDHRGRHYRGGWAIVQGISFLLTGWGALVFLIIAEILNW
jgi:hypothetical protein